MIFVFYLLGSLVWNLLGHISIRSDQTQRLNWLNVISIQRKKSLKLEDTGFNYEEIE